MHTKIYFDTNVLVDLFDVQRVNHQYSLHVFKTLLENEEIDIYINTDTLTNLFYLLRSHLKFSFEDAIEKIEIIKDSFIIISTELEQINETLEICKRHVFNDYEDVMQYICALKYECTLLITNNAKDFKNSSIEVITTKKLQELWQ